MSTTAHPKSPLPPQHQAHQPGKEGEMEPRPTVIDPHYQAADKLKNKVAIITGGDSGIGRAVAVHFAKEGADCLISYLDEKEDAEETVKMVEKEGRRCVAIAGDIGEEPVCRSIVKCALEEFGKIDILVNNAAEHHEQKEFTEISTEQLHKTDLAPK
jgi:NAD(P)-dependent dehydrogenase (short-subunit alcohol dehydrogenase family)